MPYKQLLKLFIPFLIANVVISKALITIGIPISLGAMICFVFVIIFFLMSLSFEIEQSKEYSKLKTLFFLTGILFVFYSIKLPFYDLSVYSRIVAWAKFGLMPMLIFLPFGIKLSQKDIKGTIELLIFVSLFPAILGIMQFFIPSVLPQWLIDFSLYTERSDLHMIGNLIFIRTNGMVGNPLEFSFFLLLMQLLSLTKFYQGKKIYIVYYLIFFVATITTLSRFAFAASVFMYPLVAFLLGRYKLVLVLSGIIFIAGLGLVVALGDKLDLYLMVSDRLLNKSDVQSNNVSTENRFKYFDATIDMMSEFPYFFTGYQIGKISSFGATGGKKVHDGFWLAAIIEQGVPFFIYYVFWWVYLLFACLKRIMRENAFTISGFVVVLLCITGGIVNSAYFNIVNCVTVFLIIGFNLRIYYLSTREDSDSYE